MVASGSSTWTRANCGKRSPRTAAAGAPDAVAFSPDGKTVAAAGNSIRFYDVKTGEERLRIDRKHACHLQFTDGGKTLTGAYTEAIYRWDATTGKSLTPEAGDSAVEQILVTPDGGRVVTLGQDGDAHIWDGASGRHLRGFLATGMAMSPDGRFLVWPVEERSIHFLDPNNPRLGHFGSRLRLYDIAADKFADRFPGFQRDASNLMFTGDGKTLITVDHLDGMVRFWDFEPGKVQRSFQAVPDAEKKYSGQVCCAVLSPDGKTLAVAYEPTLEAGHGPNGMLITDLGERPRPRPVRLWDIATGKELRKLDEVCGDMVFSPDGRFLFTNNGNVLETATWKRVAALPSEPFIRAIALSRDGRFLATSVSGDVIQVWEVATWTQRKQFKGHRDQPTTLAFTPKGQLLSGSIDTTVLAWDVR